MERVYLACSFRLILAIVAHSHLVTPHPWGGFGVGRYQDTG